MRSEHPESRNALGSALIVLAAACFGTLGPLSRFAEEAGVGSLGLVAWRAALGTTVMLLFIAVGTAVGRRFALPLRGIPRRDVAFLAGAAVANAVLNFAVFSAFLRISIALALLIFYLYPALVALVAVVWLGERLDRVRWAALAVCFGGLVLVLAGAGGLGTLDLAGIALAFVGGIAQVFYVLAARHGFSHVPAPQAAAITMGGGGLFYLVAAVVFGQAFVLAQPLDSGAAFWPVLVAGVLGAGVPTVSYITGIRLLGAPRAAILAMLEPVIGVALAAWLLAEQPTVLQLLGGALVIAGAAIIQLRPQAPLGEHEAVPIGT